MKQRDHIHRMGNMNSKCILQAMEIDRLKKELAEMAAERDSSEQQWADDYSLQVEKLAHELKAARQDKTNTKGIYVELLEDVAQDRDAARQALMDVYNFAKVATGDSDWMEYSEETRNMIAALAAGKE